MQKEYIEREELIAEFKRLELGENSFIERVFADGVYAIIEQFPAADVAPVRHGEWLNFYGDFSTAECELCAELYEVSPDESPQKEYFDAFKEFYRYCPNCGAKMDKEKV